MVQFCLTSPQEIPAFTSFMNTIAQENQMLFTDRSGQTEEELRALNPQGFKIAHPTVNIGASRGDDVSFGAGNLGMPTEQMVVGFNGNKLDDAKRFAEAAVTKLSLRWTIHEVPASRGAAPLAKCN